MRSIRSAVSLTTLFKQVVLTTPLTYIARFLDINKAAIGQNVNPLIRLGKLFLLMVRKLTYNASTQISLAH